MAFRATRTAPNANNLALWPKRNGIGPQGDETHVVNPAKRNPESLRKDTVSRTPSDYQLQPFVRPQHQKLLRVFRCLFSAFFNYRIYLRVAAVGIMMK